MSNAEQKPVAYINVEQRKLEWAYKYMSWDTPTVINLPKIPLYTEPPQRTWVGLTDEEMEEVRKQAVDLFVQEVKKTGKGRNEPIKFGRLVEAKLKEKNT